MPRINRGDPAYETAMREAKALFDEAMAKSAMKGRGRPAAAKSAPAPVVDDDAGVPGEVPEDIAAEIVAAGGDLGDASIIESKPAAPAAATEAAPAAATDGEAAPAERPARKARKRGR